MFAKYDNRWEQQKRTKSNRPGTLFNHHSTFDAVIPAELRAQYREIWKQEDQLERDVKAFANGEYPRGLSDSYDNFENEWHQLPENSDASEKNHGLLCRMKVALGMKR